LPPVIEVIYLKILVNLEEASSLSVLNEMPEASSAIFNAAKIVVVF
jgi:hypothetical protein